MHGDEIDAYEQQARRPRQLQRVIFTAAIQNSSGTRAVIYQEQFQRNEENVGKFMRMRNYKLCTLERHRRELFLLFQREVIKESFTCGDVIVNTSGEVCLQLSCSEMGGVSMEEETVGESSGSLWVYGEFESGKLNGNDKKVRQDIG